MEDPYLRKIFSGDRRPYDPTLPPHPQAPQSQTYAAFGPGMLEALSAQLAQGFGGTQGEQAAALTNKYKDSQITYIPQPITQVLADFAKNPYQQYGQDTGSPFLNSLLGYTSSVPAQGTGATGQFDPAAQAAAAAAEAERLRRLREEEEARRRAAMESGRQTTNDFEDRYGRNATW